MQDIAPQLLEPYHWDGGPIGCLLVHGFSGSPLNMRPLGEYLSGQGYTVRGMVLPGHCSRPEAMAAYNWQDWLEAVENEIDELARHCPFVWLIGFSMGGVLAGVTASRKSVAGLISISAPIWPQAKLTQWAFIIKFFRRFVSMGSRRQFKLPSWRYEYAPVRSVDQLMRLIRVYRKVLPVLSVPALIIQGEDDKTVKPLSAQYIYDKLGSNDKELIWVQGGGHLLLVDHQSIKTCARIEHFIRNKMGGMDND